MPCHRLMGPQYRDACPVSWWAQSMPPEDWAREARWAEEHGFTTMKVKARPWYDIDAQLRAVSEASSLHFKLDADFNGLLLGVDKAAPLIGAWKTATSVWPSSSRRCLKTTWRGTSCCAKNPQSDLDALCLPPVMTAIGEGVCDGFVIGGVKRVLDEGLSGAGQDAVLAADGRHGTDDHLCRSSGCGVKEARWPAIPCINIYSHTLLKEFDVEGGHIAVPQAPGLGVELDWDAVERFRVEDDFKRTRATDS